MPMRFERPCSRSGATRQWQPSTSCLTHEKRTSSSGRSTTFSAAAPTSFVARVGQVDGAGGGEIIDAALAIRNVLAHRSAQAVRIMNERVADFPTYPALRKQSMSKDGIGTYLAAATPGGAARLLVFKTELERIAQVLVP
jgi:hypothetical protein